MRRREQDESISLTGPVGKYNIDISQDVAEVRIGQSTCSIFQRKSLFQCFNSDDMYNYVKHYIGLQQLVSNVIIK